MFTAVDISILSRRHTELFLKLLAGRGDDDELLDLLP